MTHMEDYDSPKAHRQWRRKTIFIVSVLFGSTIVAFCTIEVCLRIFVDVTDYPGYYWDPDVGVRRSPNQHGRYIRGKHINAPYHFNAQGWNHLNDYDTRKDQGAYRICVVGDSYVEALQVPYEHTFFVLAQKKMTRVDRSVEWYAFGQSGFGTAQEYLLIRHQVLKYDPDIVIMLFVAANDLTDSSWYITRPKRHRASLLLDSDGQLVTIPSLPWESSWYVKWIRQSAIFRYFYIQNRFLATPVVPFAERAQRYLQDISDSDDAATPFTGSLSAEERMQKTWQLIEAILRETKSECAQQGVVFALAYYGSSKEIHAAFDGIPYEPLPKESDPYCIAERLDEMGKEFLVPICMRLEIPYLDLTPALVAHVRKTGQRHDFPDDLHYNQIGHAIVADAIVPWAEEMLLKKR